MVLGDRFASSVIVSVAQATRSSHETIACWSFSPWLLFGVDRIRVHLWFTIPRVFFCLLIFRTFDSRFTIALGSLADRPRNQYVSNMSAAIESKAIAPETRRLYTYEELLAELPESNQPCELWDGELIMSPTPSFFHQEIAFRFQRALHDWVEAHKLGKVVGAPIDMVLSPHRVMQPDVVFISQERLHIIQRVIMGPVDLAAEVVSLGGRNRDRIEKRDLYEQHGVKEYWIIDPEPQTADVLVWVNGRFELAMRSGVGQIAASRLLPGFETSLDYLFQAA
jgi:Uma2 family endonuclease